MVADRGLREGMLLRMMRHGHLRPKRAQFRGSALTMKDKGSVLF
jgi:exopolyphosphatase/pppGpp-phosphohydrolase